MKKVIIITGPTGVGKTKLAIAIAKYFNTPIINGDAYQMYQGLDILTAKPTKEEQQIVPHLLFDYLKEDQKYSIYNYQKDLRALILELQIPLIVGGSGLYIDSVIYDYRFEENTYHFDDDKYTNEELREILKTLDEEMAQKIPVNNRRRLIRQIELCHSQQKAERTKGHDLIYDALIITLNLERDKLYERINNRVLTMIDNGLIEEVKNHPNLEATELGKAIGYLDTIDYLNGKITKEELIYQIQLKSRHYAKRQLTWYRNHQNVTYLNIDLSDFNKTIDEAKTIITNFLKK